MKFAILSFGEIVFGAWPLYYQRDSAFLTFSSWIAAQRCGFFRSFIHAVAVRQRILSHLPHFGKPARRALRLQP